MCNARCALCKETLHRAVMERYDQLDTFLADMALEPPDNLAENGLHLPRSGESRLTLSTVHSAKGLEWRYVFVIWALDGRFPSLQSINDPEQLDEELRLMDVAAAPYRSEGGGYFSPLKILEFMACGIPVAASGGGDIPRLVKPERGGLTMEEDDADAMARTLDALLTDPVRRARMGAAGRAAAEERTWAAAARRLTDFLSGIREAGG